MPEFSRGRGSGSGRRGWCVAQSEARTLRVTHTQAHTLAVAWRKGRRGNVWQLGNLQTSFKWMSRASVQCVLPQRTPSPSPTPPLSLSLWLAGQSSGQCPANVCVCASCSAAKHDNAVARARVGPLANCDYGLCSATIKVVNRSPHTQANTNTNTHKHTHTHSAVLSQGASFLYQLQFPVDHSQLLLFFDNLRINQSWADKLGYSLCPSCLWMPPCPTLAHDVEPLLKCY